MSIYADSHIGELSGGQQQRVIIARLLAQNAKPVNTVFKPDILEKAYGGPLAIFQS